MRREAEAGFHASSASTDYSVGGNSSSDSLCKLATGADNVLPGLLVFSSSTVASVGEVSIGIIGWSKVANSWAKDAAGTLRIELTTYSVRGSR